MTPVGCRSRRGRRGSRTADDERQKTAEGYDWRHDDDHEDGEIAVTAAVYALPEKWRVLERHVAGVNVTLDQVSILWPRFWKRPKRGNRIDELAKAGALIAAEIDRLQRTARRERRK
jgi:hypothetical protein